MRSRRRATVAVAAVMLWPAQACATTFYVDPGTGSDASAGTSSAAAWATVAPVNARTMQPGDEILLKAGATHKHMLVPRGSGSAASPIRVSIYGGTERARLDPTAGGSGWAGIALMRGSSYWSFEHLEIANWGLRNAGVYLEGVSHLMFRDLYVHDVDNGFLASSPSEVAYVTISDSRIAELPRDRPSVAINLTANSHHWLVRATTLANAGDSCVLDVGHDNIYDGLDVHDCGYFTARSYGAHGLYLRGPSLTIRNSEVRDAATNCVSIRSQFAVVENNRLHGCPIGIGYFHYASLKDRPVRIVRNRIWDVASTGIYVDTGSPMFFLLVNNTVASAGGGIVVRGASSLWLENTIVTGSAHPVLAVTGVPIGSIVERANLLYTRGDVAAAFEWPGGVGTYAAWRAATGQGAGTLTVDPLLDSESVSLTPALGSPAIDAGVAATAAMTLTPACSGAVDHYCGAAPDIGAVETSPLPPAADTPAPSVAALHKRDRTPPGAPTRLRLTRRGRTSATLVWKPARGRDVASYRLLREGSTVVLVRTTRTRANARGLAPGRVYRFYVVAVDRAGNVSKRSVVVKVTLSR